MSQIYIVCYTNRGSKMVAWKSGKNTWLLFVKDSRDCLFPKSLVGHACTTIQMLLVITSLFKMVCGSFVFFIYISSYANVSKKVILLEKFFSSRFPRLWWCSCDIYVCIYVCMCVYTHIHIHVCIYVYVHI